MQKFLCLLLLLSRALTCMEQDGSHLISLPQEIKQHIIAYIPRVSEDRAQTCSTIKTVKATCKSFHALMSLPTTGGALLKTYHHHFHVNKIKAATELNQPSVFQWLKDNPKESGPHQLYMGISQLLNDTADNNRFKNIERISQFFNFSLSPAQVAFELRILSTTKPNHENFLYLLKYSQIEDSVLSIMKDTLTTTWSRNNFLDYNNERIEIVTTLAHKYPEVVASLNSHETLSLNAILKKSNN